MTIVYLTAAAHIDFVFTSKQKWLHSDHGTDAPAQRDLRAVARRALAEGHHLVVPGQGGDRRALRARSALCVVLHQAAVGHPSAAPDSRAPDRRVRTVFAREYL